MRKLNIIGAGKVGRTLARLWTQNRVFTVHDLLTAHAASAAAAIEFIGAGRAAGSIPMMRTAEVWLLTLPASRLAECCEELVSCKRLRAGDIVFHCSGSQPASELAPAARVGAFVASVHPLKSFTDAAHAAPTFAGTWCGAEGDAAALGVLKPAFAAIGARLFHIDPGSKLIYHAASVLVCNCMAALMEAGARCYEKAGLERDTAMQVMEPLARDTLDNIFRLGAAGALTGPIARGDHTVVQRQLDALAGWDPRIAAIYSQLGTIAVELAREQGKADADALRTIERALLG